ncbi:MAG: acyl-CoA dehydrogenase family protein, partial [Candidatus Latescibacterota bacterium]
MSGLRRFVVIDFSLTEEQLALQETARKFAQNEMRPHAAKYDEGHEFSTDVMKKAFQA